MSDIVSFGEWMAQRRKTLDMTQRELASQTNCALATIKKIEIDERRPSRDLAEALAGALQISADAKQKFVECARGLRPVDALASIGINGKVEKTSTPIPVVNLPAQPTPFIGREAELDQIATYLDNPTCRLLTLVGAGGIGKTRLAYQAGILSASRFPSGVYGVPLAGVNAPEFMVTAIAEWVKLPLFGSDNPKIQLLNFLQPKGLLLILDNLEHLLEGVGLLAEILEAAPRVKILTTSRERLNLSGEWLFPVNGLSFPNDAQQENAADFTAVQLFEGCARRNLPGFHLQDHLSASIRVCELVEGMPLAIELAASWVRRMPCEQIAEQIQQDLNFLSAGWRDAPERHRSIRALFDHSWRMLSAEEQDVLMKLSVFRGGFEPEAARQIAGASLGMLTSLEDKSLVQGSPFGRYDLHELIRQYAENHLKDAGKAVEAQNRHLDYYLIWAETTDKQLHTKEQLNAARRIKTEYNNLRAALTWAFDAHDAEKGLRVANALWFFWFRWDGIWDEGLRWTELGLSQTEGVSPIRTDALGNAATLAAQLGNLRAAGEYMQRGYAYSQQLGWKVGIARYVMGMSYVMPDYTEVAAQFEQAIALLRETDMPWMLATALFLYGDRARVQGDLERAQRLYDESFAISKTNQDRMLIGASLVRLGRLAALKGDYQKARTVYDEATKLVREIERPYLEYLIPLAALAIYQGDYESAQRHLKESLTYAEEFNDVGGTIHASYFLAELALHREQFSEAARLLATSITMTLSDREWQHNFTNHEFNCERLIISGKVACAMGDYPEAARLLSMGESARAQSGYLLDPLPCAEYEQAVQKTREQLGDALFDPAWKAGQVSTEEAALLYTVEYLQSKLAKG
ncbi:MAG: helix-turn-helix domain-containing protein [Anaerolineae bacterium]|nr:helix-turn-helix domain-containing protein [Anaerolineae bacterium]